MKSEDCPVDQKRIRLYAIHAKFRTNAINTLFFRFPSMKTNRGKSVVVIEGKEFIPHRISPNGLKQYWRCSRYSSGCKARGISDVSSQEISVTQEHSCNTTEADVEQRRALHELKERAKDRSHRAEKTRNLVLDACAAMPDEVAAV
uniref:FLYWCH-type domain-containing protein n=1 Tax=Steinernema glaseri TaxID=37863 RepID=A0A1I7XWB6_9BILA